MGEAADDFTYVLTLRVLVLIIYTATGNYDNGLSSMIVMVVFNYLKSNFSATKMNYKKTPAGGETRG